MNHWKYKRDNLDYSSRLGVIAKDVRYNDNIIKQFTNYTSLTQLVDLIDEYPCLYECITPGIPQRIYFDIDGKQDVDTYKLREELERVIVSCVQSFKSVTPDVIFCTSSNSEKLSYHVILSNIYVSNNKENGAFCKMVVDNLDSKYKDLIDTRVYDRFRQFRILGCNKLGSDRMKKLLVDNKPIDPRRMSMNEYINQLSNTLISYQSDKMIMIRPPVIEVNRVVVDMNIDTISIMEAYEEYCADVSMPLMHVREVRGNTILLRRISPGYCSICNREHANENAYISVNEDGFYYYNCYRADAGEVIGHNREIDESDMIDLQ